MNILIIGSGAREQAIAAALNRSPQKPTIYCCGNSLNPGIKQMAYHYWVGNILDVNIVVEKAKSWCIDLAIIGPEAPLEKGLADLFWQNQIPTIGPKKKLAQIETSKNFARELMQKYKIPGLPRYQTFTTMSGVQEYLESFGENQYVVKANGLTGGKGVKVGGDHLHTFKEALLFCQEILDSQDSFIIEEKLIGQEFSFMCFCDGEHISPMPLVQDHKRAYVGDKGPNTGGMGSYTDANHSLPFLNEADVRQAWQINQSILQALKKETHENYIGILYGSYIATQNGIYNIEFNARFGDPESLNVLTILESDFVAICQAMVKGQLAPEDVKFAKSATVCKYAVPKGYPEDPLKNVAIEIGAVKNKSCLYLGAVHVENGKIIATGSRTAAYVGVADTIPAAEEIAEKEICGIIGPLYHRQDIGTPKLIQQRMDVMRKLRAGDLDEIT